MTDKPSQPPEFNPKPPEGEWSEMELRELHESGLLWQVNRAVLWPMGLALTLEADNNADGTPGEYKRLYVSRVDPFEPIASGDGPDDEGARLDHLVEWMKVRFRG